MGEYIKRASLILFAAVFITAVFLFLHVEILKAQDSINTTAFCQDSDGGINEYVIGTLTYNSGLVGEPDQVRTDYCLGGNVIEYYCDTPLAGGVLYNSASMSCPSGHTCIAGACVASPDTFSVDFNSLPPNPISGQYNLCVHTTQPADSVSFFINETMGQANSITTSNNQDWCYLWNTVDGNYPDGNYTIRAVASQVLEDVATLPITREVNNTVIPPDDVGTITDGGGTNTTLEYIINVNKPKGCVEDYRRNITCSGAASFFANSTKSLNSLKILFDNLNTPGPPDYSYKAVSSNNYDWSISNLDTNELLNANYRYYAQGTGQGEQRLSTNSIDINFSNPIYFYFDPQPPELAKGEIYLYLHTSQPVARIQLEITGAGKNNTDFVTTQQAIEDFDDILTWKYLFNTSAIEDNIYQIKAIAYDNKDNIVAESNFHTILIQNQSGISCKDSDNGENYYVEGTTTWGPIVDEMLEATDYCENDGKTLIEHYCSYNSEIEGYFSYEVRYSCPLRCQQGICTYDAETNHIYFYSQVPKEVSGQLYFYTRTLWPVSNVQYKISSEDLEFESIIDGIQVSIETTADQLTWSYYFDSTPVDNGIYTISAQSFDNEGNMLAETDGVGFEIFNEEIIPEQEEEPIIEEPIVEEPIEEVPIQEISQEPEEEVTLDEPPDTGGAIEPVIVEIDLTQLCQNEEITDIKYCEDQMRMEGLPKECQKLSISNQQSCEEYLNQRYIKPQCQETGITDADVCLSYIERKYLSDVKCLDVEDDVCKEIVKTEFSGLIVERETKLDSLRKIIPTDKDCPEGVVCDFIKPDIGDVQDLASIIIEDVSKITLTRATDQVFITQQKQIISTAPAVINLDSDQDGISDEIEQRLGTDPNLSDSDNDGVTDRQEILDGSNPLGEGEKETVLAPVETALINQAKFEHPKTAGAQNDEYKVEEVVHTQESVSPTLKGTAEPDKIVTIYIYSDLPLMITTRTNEYGNWEYTLQNSLIDGDHEVYVVLNDNTGKVAYKSSPLSFLVREAKAVSVQDYIKTGEQKEADEAITIYLISVIIFIFSGLVLFLAYFIQRKKLKEIDEDTTQL
ncbi:hypothetical protein KKA15_04785 [Patescibacteria group bacterium]|nr:hypothetical protein [Patescibacteria group bacterium]